MRQPDRILRRCALSSCHKLHTNDKYCSVACKVEDSKKVERREAAKRSYARELLGPDEPLNPPWTPREKPPPIMSEDEQTAINKACTLRDDVRTKRPLTRDLARMMGAAW